jgi:hypothetical protein
MVNFQFSSDEGWWMWNKRWKMMKKKKWIMDPQKLGTPYQKTIVKSYDIYW